PTTIHRLSLHDALPISLIDKLPAQLAGAVDPAKLADDKQLKRIEGIINSMTRAERAKPELIKASRKRRIAAGAGVPVQAVNQLLDRKSTRLNSSHQINS